MTLKDRIRSFLDGHVYFSVNSVRQAECVKSISESSVFSGPSIWVLVFAIFIASLGLNVNSTAVIIGAMLISPLMGPIMGMGLALGINDFDLLKRAATNFAIAVVVSILTATVFFLLSPLKESQSELLARTSPTLYDVMIAFFGGAAGIVATASFDKGNNVIPGVAIATALMPPLCTAGYGLANANWHFFFGAFYLFFINTVFICGATYIGVRLLGFKYVGKSTSGTTVRNRRIALGIVIATLIPAAYITYWIVEESVIERRFENYSAKHLDFDGARVISKEIDRNAHTVTVVAIGREISDGEIKSAESSLPDFGFNGYELQLLQGSRSDSIIAANTKLLTNSEEYLRKIKSQKNKISALEQRVEHYGRYEAIGCDVLDELQTLYPEVSTLALSEATEWTPDSVGAYTLAIVGAQNTKPLDTQRIEQWLCSRLKCRKVKVVVEKKEQ